MRSVCVYRKFCCIFQKLSASTMISVYVEKFEDHG